MEHNCLYSIVPFRSCDRVSQCMDSFRSRQCYKSCSHVGVSTCGTSIRNSGVRHSPTKSGESIILARFACHHMFVSDVEVVVAMEFHDTLLCMSEKNREKTMSPSPLLFSDRSGDLFAWNTSSERLTLTGNGPRNERREFRKIPRCRIANVLVMRHARLFLKLFKIRATFRRIDTNKDADHRFVFFTRYRLFQFMLDHGHRRGR